MCSLESRIKDTLIVIDERLESILEMPRSGTCMLSLKKKEDGLKVVLERDKLRI